MTDAYDLIKKRSNYLTAQKLGGGFERQSFNTQNAALSVDLF